MHLRIWLAVPLGAVLLLAASARSEASVGVGVQAGAVRLAGVAHPGAHYNLPPVYVVNTGTQPESVTIQIERVSAGSGRTVPPGWITVSTAPVRLARAQSARIPLSLTVPSGAPPGHYASDVVARGSAVLAAGGADFAVAAATGLEFTVVSGPVSAGWFSAPGWLLPYVVAVVLLCAAAVLVRRTGIRIRIEREPDRAAAEGKGDDVA